MASESDSRGRSLLVLGAWSLLAAGLAAAFGPYLAEIWSRWFPRWDETDLSLYERITSGESYYTHGPLIPLVSLLIALLLVRHTRIEARPNRRAGLAVLAGSLLLHVMASQARVNFAQGVALLGTVAGLVVLFWGWGGLRRLWFPIALLGFMIPLPEVTIGELNFRLKMIATDSGVALANAAGVIADSAGNQVFLTDDRSLTVANVCNGLRTLISLVAFGALYAYVCRLRGPWRLVLFALSVPVALASNAVRIASLIIVADVWDVETATGWFHGGSGLMIYVLAFLLMFSLERLILWGHKVVGRPIPDRKLMADVRRGEEDADQGRRMRRAVASPRGVVAVVLLGLAAGGVWWLQGARPPLWNANVAAGALPRRLVIDGRRLRGHPRTMSRETLGILETQDYFYSIYEGPDAAPVEFCIIFSRDNRRGTHPPDQCLEGGGSEITHKGAVVVGSDSVRPVPCREIVVQQGRQRRYFLYTYKCGATYTDSFLWQQLTIFGNGLLRRNASGALIRLSTPVRQDVAEARRWCMRFMEHAVPYLDRNLQVEAASP